MLIAFFVSVAISVLAALGLLWPRLMRTVRRRGRGRGRARRREAPRYFSIDLAPAPLRQTKP